MADTVEVELASPPGSAGQQVAVDHHHQGDEDDGLDEEGVAPGIDIEATRHEVLEMNSYAMHLCQEKSFSEALDCLETALLRVQALSDHMGTADDASRQLLEQLKATTLNNLGVVGCHRGDYASSLEHLEAARNLEARAGIQSPSTALNLCAVYNAVGDSERASAHAQEAISLLNADDQGLTDETKSLWGAAWHNLGIAELNKLDKATSHTKNADVLYTFRNAMAATKDLLGPQHPMTVAVHDTYRKIRDKLKAEGAFKERQPVITLPRIRNGKTLPRPPSPEHPTRHALMGGSNNHGNGKYTAPPPVSRFVGVSAYKKPEPPKTPRGGGAATSRSKYAGGDLFHPTAAMKQARRQYCSQHPLLPAKGGSRQGGSRSTSGLPAISGDRAVGQTAPNTARRSNQQAPQQQQQASYHTDSPRAITHHSNAYGPAPGTARQPPKRRLSELLLGDMWVEVQVPRHASPNNHSGSPNSNTNGPNNNNNNNVASGVTGGGAMSPVRPGYGEALYVIDPADAALEPIAEPGTHAQLDHAPASRQQHQQQQQRQQQQQQHEAQAPTDVPAAAAAETQEEEQRVGPEPTGAADEFADALGSQIGQYPGLQMLVGARA